MASKAKKKSAKKSRPHKDQVIELLTDIGPDSEPTLYKNVGTHGADRVRWWNKDTRGRTLYFTVWPFAEPPQAIAIEAGKKSDWFTIYEGDLSGRYGYIIDPTMDPNGPPDGPGVIVDD